MIGINPIIICTGLCALMEVLNDCELTSRIERLLPSSFIIIIIQCSGLHSNGLAALVRMISDFFDKDLPHSIIVSNQAVH